SNLFYERRQVKLEVLQGFYDALDAPMKQHDFGRCIQSYLELSNRDLLENGDDFVDFAVFDIKGDTFHLSERFGDKLTVLEFRSPYCMPSMRNIPEINDLLKKHGDQVQVYTFCSDTRSGSWNDLNEDGSQSIKVWDGQGRWGQTGVRYNIEGSPYLFIISPEGKILDHWFGYGKGLLEEKVKPHL
ncbi:MAG: thioredoxin-like domain-containing protein, partial [Bacteroidota bacterium]